MQAHLPSGAALARMGRSTRHVHEEVGRPDRRPRGSPTVVHQVGQVVRRPGALSRGIESWWIPSGLSIPPIGSSSALGSCTPKESMKSVDGEEVGRAARKAFSELRCVRACDGVVPTQTLRGTGIFIYIDRDFNHQSCIPDTTCLGYCTPLGGRKR